VAKITISDATYKQMLKVATDEPSFTAPYLAWLTGMSRSTASFAVERMREERRVDLVEPHHGVYAAVYVVRPVRHVSAVSPVRPALPELDAGIGIDAPRRGEVVPLTGRAKGPSGKPSTDRKRQTAGHRVKRARQGT
jgi:hypothetical protein